MKHDPVVVGIDGSPAAEIAIRWGAIEAAALRSPLHLVYAVAPGGSPSLAGEVVYKAVAQARAQARGLEPRTDIDSRIETGSPSAALVKASGTAALVVIGSRGLGVMLGALVGSTGLDLAANARCPVVVVRPDLGAMAGIRVVIGYDGSSDSRAAVNFGLDYARRHDLAVRVVAARVAGTGSPRKSSATPSTDAAGTTPSSSGSPATPPNTSCDCRQTLLSSSSAPAAAAASPAC
ncbi:MAG TPA: universal stress protein [Kribbella sp.]